jgi:hypothetical protein
VVPGDVAAFHLSDTTAFLAVNFVAMAFMTHTHVFPDRDSDLAVCVRFTHFLALLLFADPSGGPLGATEAVGVTTTDLAGLVRRTLNGPFVTSASFLLAVAFADLF